MGHTLQPQRSFAERTRVHNLQLRVNELRREIDLFESNASKARTLGYEGEAQSLEKKLPRLREELARAEHTYDVAATEEAKIQHDQAMEREHDRELEEFYAQEDVERRQRFEAWRKRKGSPRR